MRNIFLYIIFSACFLQAQSQNPFNWVYPFQVNNFAPGSQLRGVKYTQTAIIPDLDSLPQLPRFYQGVSMAGAICFLKTDSTYYGFTGYNWYPLGTTYTPGNGIQFNGNVIRWADTLYSPTSVFVDKNLFFNSDFGNITLERDDDGSSVSIAKNIGSFSISDRSENRGVRIKANLNDSAYLNSEGNTTYKHTGALASKYKIVGIDSNSGAMVILPAVGGSGADSSIFQTNYRSDTAKSNLRNEIGGKIGGTLNNSRIVFSNFGSVKDTSILTYDRATQRVGIGTATPGERLDVLGVIRSSENATRYSEFQHLNTAGSFPRVFFRIFGPSPTNVAMFISPGNATGGTFIPNLLAISTASDPTTSGSRNAVLYADQNMIKLTARVSGSNFTIADLHLQGNINSTTDATMVLKQNGQVGITNTSPAASAALDITSNTRGVLFPRMTAAQRLGISSPAPGLMALDIDSLYRPLIFNGTSWRGLAFTGEGGTDTANLSLRIDTMPKVVFYGKNITNDSTILELSNGLRFAAKDSVGVLNTDSLVLKRYGFAANNIRSWNAGGTTAGAQQVGSSAATSDSVNMLIGYNAGRDLTSGYRNIFLGARSGETNTTGINNIGIGLNSNYANINNRIAIGVDALGFQATGGNGAVAIGTSALSRTTATGGYNQHNVAIGFEALMNATSANQNIAIGFAALKNVTTGTGNIFIGNNLDNNAAANADLSGSRNIVISNGLALKGGSSDNVIIVPNSGTNTGTTTHSQVIRIGTSNPAINATGNNRISMTILDSRNQADSSNTITIGSSLGITGFASGRGHNNIKFGISTAGGITGNGNVVIGNNTWNQNVYRAGVKNTVIGSEISSLSYDIENSIIIGNGAPNPTTGNNNLIIGVNGNNWLTRFPNGQWLFNQTGSPVTSATTSAALEINGTAGGILLPRLTTVQRDAIASPATGLTLFCTDCTANDASTGVLQTFSSGSWRNHY